MDKTGYIEIAVVGKKGNFPLSPDNYDIREIRALLEHAEHMLYPGDKRNRPVISYHMEAGSVRHRFRTSIQQIIGFNALMDQVLQQGSIDFLELQTARAIEFFQDTAIKQHFEIDLTTSLENAHTLHITSATNFYRTESMWADAEFYFYGKLTNAGGKRHANIHLLTEDQGTLIIQTPISFLEQYDENPLYKTFGVRVSGRQHTTTGEIDTSSLKFLELIDYRKAHDEEYLKSLREKAKKSWLRGIDPDTWLRKLRGGYDA